MNKIIKAIKNPRIIYQRLTYQIVRLYDAIRDRSICGFSLAKKDATSVEGGTSYSATCYWTLDEIFSDADFTADDSFVDVGCGKGRLLAYMLSRKFPGRITGIEMNPTTAAVARKWLQHFPQDKVRLIEGDAFRQQYDEYTVIYLFRPFETDYFMRFIQLLEQQLTHPVKLYYMTDQINGYYLKEREGWELVFRRACYRKYGLCMWSCPQKYSMWLYTPKCQAPSLNEE